MIGPIAVFISLNRRLRQLRCAGFHHERVLQRVPGRVSRAVSTRLIVSLVVADQMLRNSKSNVALQPLVTDDEDLRNEGLVVRLASEEMQGGGPIRVPVLRAKEFTARPVGWDRIPRRFYRSEREPSFDICNELSSEVHVRLARVLILVQANGRSLPDVDLHAGNRPALRIADRALHKQSG